MSDWESVYFSMSIPPFMQLSVAVSRLPKLVTGIGKAIDESMTRVVVPLAICESADVSYYIG